MPTDTCRLQSLKRLQSGPLWKKLANPSWRALDQGLWAHPSWGEIWSLVCLIWKPTGHHILYHSAPLYLFSWRRKSEKVPATHLTIRNARCFPASQQSPSPRRGSQSHHIRHIKTEIRAHLHKIHTPYTTSNTLCSWPVPIPATFDTHV